MASILILTQKINSLGNLQKVTRAMNMIASIRFRKLMARQKALELFDGALGQVVDASLRPFRREKNRWVGGAPGTGTVHAFMFTSDRGLCGSHNHAVFRELDRLAQRVRADSMALEVSCWGGKGAVHARRRGYPIQQTRKAVPFLGPDPWVEQALARFAAGEIQSVVVIFNRFVSTIRQETVCQTVLPLGGLADGLGSDGPAPRENSEPEPDPPEGFLEEAAGLALRYLVDSAQAHSSLSEQAARMMAMDNASKNARELTDQAVKDRNRVRQAGITEELIEVISGKEAMKR